MCLQLTKSNNCLVKKHEEGSIIVLRHSPSLWRFVVVTVLILLASALAADTTESDGGTTQSAGQSARTPGSPKSATHEVFLYYFYSEPRCVTCKKLETLTEELLKERYAEQLREKELRWETLDLGRSEKKHYH